MRYLVTIMVIMFPMYVGMNRLTTMLMTEIRNVPHVCGDEPNGKQRKVAWA